MPLIPALAPATRDLIADLLAASPLADRLAAELVWARDATPRERHLRALMRLGCAALGHPAADLAEPADLRAWLRDRGGDLDQADATIIVNGPRGRLDLTLPLGPAAAFVRARWTCPRCGWSVWTAPAREPADIARLVRAHACAPAPEGA